jgi:PAS domain S-box-containing protein
MRRLSRYPGWDSLLGVLAALGGVFALLGWWLEMPVLTHWHLSRVAMNPLTAICFMVSGIGLAFASLSPDARNGRRFSAACGMMVLSMATLQLLRFFEIADLSLDQWLFAAQLGDSRMAPNTAASFVVVGLSLLLLDFPLKLWGVSVGEGLAIFTAVVSMVSIVGYTYGAESLYRFSHWIPMAMNTALIFQVISLGLLFARPQRGVMRLVLSPTLGGLMARRLLPFAVIVPGLLGWIRLVGQRYGWFDMEIGLAYSVASTMVMFALVIIWSAWVVCKVDQERQEADESLRRRSQEVFDLYNHAPCGYHSLNGAGLIIAMNDTELRWLGYTREEIVGRRSFTDLLTPSSKLVFLEAFERFKREGSISDLDFTLIRGDGSHIPVILSATAIYDSRGNYLASRSTVFDAGRLRQAEREVRRLNETLELRVQERTQQLARANAELAQKSQENETFVYSVSHDLRSPLVNLQGFSKELSLAAEALRELLRDSRIPEEVRERGYQILDEDVQPSLQFIQSAVIRLGGIIDALLRLSRVGRVEYQPTMVDLNKVLIRIREAANRSIQQSGARLELEDLPPAWGDVTALELVFANLIDNAVKYLDPQRPGLITVGSLPPTTTGTGEEMRIYFVRDNGIGIPDNQREKIFHAFRRLEPNRSPGEGMGLSIVRRIVERHGGTIWVESHHGEGSQFFVSLRESPPDDDSPGFRASDLRAVDRPAGGPAPAKLKWRTAGDDRGLPVPPYQFAVAERDRNPWGPESRS